MGGGIAKAVKIPTGHEAGLWWAFKGFVIVTAYRNAVQHVSAIAPTVK